MYLWNHKRRRIRSGNDDGDGKKQNDAVSGERATQTRTLFEK